MAKKYIRNGKSMVDIAVTISTANENCEGDNWGDMINLCGEGDILIGQLEADTAQLEVYLDELRSDNRQRACLELDATATIKGLRADIDGFWDGLYNGYNIESREEIEKDCEESWAKGTSPMAAALHFVWKREPKVTKLTAQLAEQEWVSVEERLPKQLDDRVLIFVEGVVSEGFYMPETDEWFYVLTLGILHSSGRVDTVTHWKPISLPKADNEPIFDTSYGPKAI
jgi:hypothetical protein